MKKREDLKKLLREEKIVSTTENFAAKILILSFLFLSNLSAQIPINGFCRYREFSVKPNFTNVSGIDYTADGFRDLVVFKPNENKYLTLTANDKSNFGNAVERYSPFPISELHAMTDENNARSYFVLSRKSRQVGVASFSKSGSIIWQSKIKFNGYPSKIDVGDVDNNSRRVGLVSGGTLKGLHVVSENKNILREKIFAKNKSFVFSTFIDLDYDKYLDIAAFDGQTNSFVFFYNNHSGGFDESRSLAMVGDLKEIKSADLNSDGFTDLVFVRGNYIEALIGDSVSSFQKKMILETPVTVDKYVIQDFNGDGFNDVAYLNKESGELYISYGRNTNTFYPPILYMRKNGLVDLASYVDRGGKKLVALSSEGNIYLINSVRFNDDSFSVSLGLNPGPVTTFDYLNDKFNDICFINDSEPALNLVISERRNLFRTFYSIPVSTAFDEIQVDDMRNRQKTFFLFTRGERTVEAVKVNFDNYNYTRKFFYTDAPIVDLKISVDKTTDRTIVYLLTKRKEMLSLQSFEYRDFRYVVLNSYDVVDSADGAALSLGASKEIYFWKKSAGELDLDKIDFEKKVNQPSKIIIRKIAANEKLNYGLVCFDENLDKSKPVGAIISSQKNSDLYFIYRNQVLKFPLHFQSGEKPSLKYYIDAANNKIFFSYADKRSKLRGVSIDLRSRLAKESELADAKKIKSYSVENLSAYRSFFIYSDIYQNTITFQKF